MPMSEAELNAIRQQALVREARENRYEPLFREEDLRADLPVEGRRLAPCGAGKVSVHGLPYAQAMNQGADIPPRAAATMTLGDPQAALDQFMSAVALEGAKLSQPIMQGVVPPYQSEAAGWKHTSAAGHTLEIRSGTAPATPLATQVGGAHYKDMKVQPVEYIHANGIGYFEGNVIKYVSRWREKGGTADLEKAKHYIDLLIELERRPEAGNKI